MDKFKKIGKVVAFYLVGHILGVFISLLLMDTSYILSVYLKIFVVLHPVIIITTISSYKFMKKADVDFVKEWGKSSMIYGMVLTVAAFLISKII